MHDKILNRITTAAAAVLFCGCISHHSTVYKDVERTPVQFESDAAARLFYETMSRKGGGKRTESTTNFAIPIVFEHERKVVPGRNVEFNEAVAICDSNRDGKITEQEANIYANMK
jgi:hypothetical protein